MYNLAIICHRAVVLNACFDDYQMLELVLSMYEIRYKNSPWPVYTKDTKGNFITATFLPATDSE